MNSDTPSEQPFYVLIKRGLFWRPKDNGYTCCIEDAGLYTKAEAEKRIHGGEEPVTMDLASKYATDESTKIERLERENTALKQQVEKMTNIAEKCRAR